MKIFKAITLFFFITNLLNAESIAEIPEASGICFLRESNELIVVNDEGWIYRLTTKGEILEKKYLGHYDFEGVTTYKNRLLLAVEDENAIFVLNKKSFKIIKKVKMNKHKRLKKSKKHGVEAITVYNGEIYLSHQTSGLFRVDGIKHEQARVREVYKLGYKDIAGLSVKNNILYMCSDKQNLLIKYDLKRKKTLLKVKLPKAAQEGLCFDDEENVYIADDNGRILKFKTWELGLR